TKKGKRGLGISVNLGGSTGNLDKSTWLKYQHKYGAGYYDPTYNTYSDAPSPDSHFLFYDPFGTGKDALVVPTTEDASFGAAFDPNLMVYQWTSFDPTSPNFGKKLPWVAAKHDPTDFFVTPYSTSASLFLQGGGDKTNFKLGYTRNDDKGFLPNSKLTKDLVDFRADYKVSDKLTAAAAINFSKVTGVGRYGSGYSDTRNVAGNFREWWQTNVDIYDLKDAYFRTHKNITWNMTDPPGDIGPAYWDNPYYSRYESYENDNRYRFISNISLNYKATEWLNVMGRISLDTYDGLQEERNGIESINIGSYSRYNQNFREYNYDILATANKDISTDLNIKGLIGGNLRNNFFNSIFAQTNGGLILPGVYDLANSINPIDAPSEEQQTRQVGGVFAGVTLTYKEMLILDATARRDQSSTLPAGKNDYFYPAISGGFVFSKLLPDKNWLSFGKLRLNYAEVGNDAPFDYLIDSYDQPTPFNGVPLFSVGDTKKNKDLKPERTRSLEAGLEMSFLKNRVGFDVTLYKTNTIDQIIPVTISGATGYTTNIINAGNVENKGIEVTLNLVPVKTRDFTWNMNVNFTTTRSKVLSLTGGTSNILLGSFQGGVTLNAVVGKPLGVLRGSDFIYDSVSHQKVLDGGYYEITPKTDQILGNIVPDWTGGINNSFTYKGVSLSFLIDASHGGSIYSIDQWYGQGTGLPEFTAGNNDKGNPIRNPVAQGGGILFPGVTEDGKPNTTYAEITGLQGYGYNNFPNAGYVYDASYVKLRELNITYSLPGKWFTKNMGVTGVDLSLYGKNLWILHKNLPDADPEEGPSSGNIQGFQVGSYPTYRTYGVNINVKF
ncbi:MAG: TonB-dependent receptor, partial [Ginsengibacter sp.]